MTAPANIAKHLRDVYYGGNWTVSNVKDQLADVTWEQAITQVHGFNTIATLTYHIGYFVTAALGVLREGVLEAHDKYSFDHPPISSTNDWETMRDAVLADLEELAQLVEQLPETTLWEPFADAKYGTYYRNLHGIIEHTHYHLGQIALIKKLVRQARQQ